MGSYIPLGSKTCSHIGSVARVRVCGTPECSACTGGPHQCPEDFSPCLSAVCYADLLVVQDATLIRAAVADVNKMPVPECQLTTLLMECRRRIASALNMRDRVDRVFKAVAKGFEAASANYTRAKEQVSQLAAGDCRLGTEYYPQLFTFGKFIDTEFNRTKRQREDQVKAAQLLSPHFEAVHYASHLLQALSDKLQQAGLIKDEQDDKKVDAEELDKLLGDVIAEAPTTAHLDISTTFRNDFRPSLMQFLKSLENYAIVVSNLPFLDYALLRYLRLSPYEKKFQLTSQYFYAQRDHRPDYVGLPTYGFTRALLDTGLAPCALSHDIIAAPIKLKPTDFSRGTFDQLPKIIFPLQNLRAHEWACRLEEEGEYALGTAARFILEQPMCGSKTWADEFGGPTRASLNSGEVISNLTELIEGKYDMVALTVLVGLHQLSAEPHDKSVSNPARSVLEKYFNSTPCSYPILVRRWHALKYLQGESREKALEAFKRIASRNVGSAIWNQAAPYLERTPSRRNDPDDSATVAKMLALASDPELPEPFPRAGLTLAVSIQNRSAAVSAVEEPVFLHSKGAVAVNIRLWRAALAGVPRAAHELAKRLLGDVTAPGSPYEAFCWYAHAVLEKASYSDIVAFFRNPEIAIPIFPKLPYAQVNEHKPADLGHFLKAGAKIEILGTTDYVTDYTRMESDTKTVIHPLAHFAREVACLFAIVFRKGGDIEALEKVIESNPGLNPLNAEELTYDTCVLSACISLITRGLAFESGKAHSELEQEIVKYVELPPSNVANPEVFSLVEEMREAARCFGVAGEADSRALYRFVQLFMFFAVRTGALSQEEAWAEVCKLQRHGGECTELMILSALLDTLDIRGKSALRFASDDIEEKAIWTALYRKGIGHKVFSGLGIRPCAIHQKLLRCIAQNTLSLEETERELVGTLYFNACKLLVHSKRRLVFSLDPETSKFRCTVASRLEENPMCLLSSPAGARYLELVRSPPENHLIPLAGTANEGQLLRPRERHEERTAFFPVLSSVMSPSFRARGLTREESSRRQVRDPQLAAMIKKLDSILVERKEQVAELVPGYRQLIADLAEAVRSTDFIGRLPTSKPSAEQPVISVFEKYAEAERTRLGENARRLQTLFDFAPIPAVMLAKLDLAALESAPYYYSEFYVPESAFEERLAILEQGVTLGCNLAGKRLAKLLCLTCQELNRSLNRAGTYQIVQQLPSDQTQAIDDLITQTSPEADVHELSTQVQIYLNACGVQPQTNVARDYYRCVLKRLNAIAHATSLDLTSERRIVSSYLDLLSQHKA